MLLYYESQVPWSLEGQANWPRVDYVRHRTRRQSQRWWECTVSDQLVSWKGECCSWWRCHSTRWTLHFSSQRLTNLGPRKCLHDEYCLAWVCLHLKWVMGSAFETGQLMAQAAQRQLQVSNCCHWNDSWRGCCRGGTRQTERCNPVNGWTRRERERDDERR